TAWRSSIRKDTEHLNQVWASVINYNDSTLSVSLPQSQIPNSFRLGQNYPNPFNPSTTIRYDLPENTHVSLVIYDILGRELVRLVDVWIASGYQNVVWNGRDKHGREVPTGIYIARLVTTKYSRAIKMLLLR
ncbi:MAG: T9SS type A sorting domain-containing protein, partial [Candidatus Neomarinimicrobiota bacterium]